MYPFRDFYPTKHAKYAKGKLNRISTSVGAVICKAYEEHKRRNARAVMTRNAFNDLKKTSKNFDRYFKQSSRRMGDGKRPKEVKSDIIDN